MDFLKKNWSKIIISVLYLLGALLFILALADKEAGMASIYGPLLAPMEVLLAALLGGSTASLVPAIGFGMTAFIISGIIFFLGMACYTICKMFRLSFTKFILLGIGAINTILAFLFLFVESVKDGGADSNGFNLLFDKDSSSLLVALFAGSIILFAFVPLVKGIKKMICCCCEGDKKAAAPVKAAASTPAPAKAAAPAAKK